MIELLKTDGILMKTRHKIVNLLKTEGEMTTQMIADRLKLTSMGARQHLLDMEKKGDISHADKKAKRGRPTRYWSLTSQSYQYFPDRHDELAAQMVESVKVVFGEQGLEQLISHREKQSYNDYKKIISKHTSLIDQLEALAGLRSAEGYMASIEYDQEQNIYWLLENHCPICAAASQCLNFCRSELELFQKLFEKQAYITREEHIIKGAYRCAYRVTPIESSKKTDQKITLQSRHEKHHEC